MRMVVYVRKLIHPLLLYFFLGNKRTGMYVQILFSIPNPSLFPFHFIELIVSRIREKLHNFIIYSRKSQRIAFCQQGQDLSLLLLLIFFFFLSPFTHRSNLFLYFKMCHHIRLNMRNFCLYYFARLRYLYA